MVSLPCGLASWMALGLRVIMERCLITLGEGEDEDEGDGDGD